MLSLPAPVSTAPPHPGSGPVPAAVLPVDPTAALESRTVLTVVAPSARVRTPSGPRFQVYTEVVSTSRRGLEVLSGEQVRWRLLTSNHRCLGISSSLFDDLEAAERSSARLRDDIEATVARVVPAGASLWTWTLGLEGEDVARSARGYQRRLECELALRQFRAMTGLASLQPGVQRFRRGARR